MVALVFLFSLIGITSAQAAAEGPLSNTRWQDHVKGALIGSVIGDILGRLTEPLGTSSAIKLAYGSNGISSINQISPCDFMYEPFRYKSAAYSSNTVLSSLTFQAALEGRKKKLSDEELTSRIAGRMIDFFGTRKYYLDPHFSFRKHPATTLKAAERLIECMDNTKKSWWLVPKKERKKNCKLIVENESGALARAWPIGLVFADDPEKVSAFTAHQTYLTHEHPTVIAACVAFSTGIVSAFEGKEPQEVVHEMVRSSDIYAQAESQYNAQGTFTAGDISSKMLKR